MTPHTTPAGRRPRRARSGSLTLAPGLVLMVALAGCTAVPVEARPAPYTLPAPPTGTVPVPDPGATALPPLAPTPVPTEPYLVGRRALDLTNGDRPLRTLLYFPSRGFVDGGWSVALGTFPLVLFSHGLGARPEDYQSSLWALAAAGFVVAAPTYPHTSTTSTQFDPVDLVNQPSDASAVITAILTLGQTNGDGFAGHLDAARIAAVGHSAGGYTTMGLLSGARDDRIRCAVVLAGASLGGAYTGPPASVLFVHGDADEVVPYDYGRTAFGQVPWPKAFLTVVGGEHTEFLAPDSPAATAVALTVLDFLRATLYGDVEALARIPAEAAVESVTRFESTLVATPPLDPSPSPSLSPWPSPSPSPLPSPSLAPSGSPAGP